MSNREHLEKLIHTHRRRLEVLENQQATMGIHTPAYIVTEIATAREEIEKLQQQLKEEYGVELAPLPDSPARPPPKPGSAAAKEIFVSYAWGGESEEIVNQLDAAFQAKGITLVRDKRDLGFKGLIKEFMTQLGRGKGVIVVISEKYLKSENCMFELVEIARNGDFYDRIFPIVLADANIYKPIDRVKYVQYWEQQIQELDEALKSVGSANLQGLREDIDLYVKIRETIAGLTDTLKNMNALTPEEHRESGFAALIEAVERKMAK